MHYVLCADFSETTSSVLSDDSTCQDPIWQRGERLDTVEYDLSRLVFVSETEHMHPFPDFSRDGHGCLVVSEKLKQFFINSGIDNIDYYPASIVEYGESTPHPGYYAANIIGLIQCVDRDASELDEDEDGDIDFIDELVVDETIAGDIPLFRLEEMPDIILIHERFKVPLEQAGITGLQLIPPDQWDGFDGYK
jgi:hypothetical protein